MKRLRIISAILTLLVLVPLVEASARPVSEASVKQFRDQFWRKWHRQDTPYVFLPRVIGKVNYPNLKRLESNWRALPLALRQKIYQHFHQNGLEKFFWLMFLESSADPDRVSRAGAIGLFQVMPGVAKDVCSLMLPDLYDPWNNAQCAVKILKRCQRFGGWQAQAICYNGKLSCCPWNGYQKCLARKAKAGNTAVLGSMLYPIKFHMFAKIGEYFFLSDVKKPPKAQVRKHGHKKR